MHRMEASPLMMILETESLLDVLQRAQKLLSTQVLLDEWDQVFAEANEAVAALSFTSRICTHVAEELTKFVFPSMLFNSTTERWVRGTSLGPDEASRPTMHRGLATAYVEEVTSLTTNLS